MSTLVCNKIKYDFSLFSLSFLSSTIHFLDSSITFLNACLHTVTMFIFLLLDLSTLYPLSPSCYKWGSWWIYCQYFFLHYFSVFASYRISTLSWHKTVLFFIIKPSSLCVFTVNIFNTHCKSFCYGFLIHILVSWILFSTSLFKIATGEQCSLSVCINKAVSL